MHAPSFLFSCTSSSSAWSCAGAAASRPPSPSLALPSSLSHPWEFLTDSHPSHPLPPHPLSLPPPSRSAWTCAKPVVSALKIPHSSTTTPRTHPLCPQACASLGSVQPPANTKDPSQARHLAPRTCAPTGKRAPCKDTLIKRGQPQFVINVHRQRFEQLHRLPRLLLRPHQPRHGQPAMTAHNGMSIR